MNILKRWMHGKSCVFTMVVTLLALSSCGEDEMVPEGDYFPLQDGLHWVYQIDYHIDYKDTITLFTNGDTLIGNTLYQKIENIYGAFKMVRREGSRYFEWKYSGERLFLDTSVPVSRSWTQQSATGKTVYFVKGRNGRKVVNGVLYNNVMTILEIIHNEYFTDTVYHYYARGVGEIVMHYPYDTRRPYMPELEYTLLNQP